MPAPSPADITALLLWYALAFGTLGLTEWLHRRRGWGADTTRKLIHVSAGGSLFVILWLFDHPHFGIIPFASFTLLNYWFRRRRTFRGMDSERASYGTVYFALSITILLAWLWRRSPDDRSALAAAAVMMMTWGDAAAALVGQRFGQHRYHLWGHARTWEGSAAMLAVSIAASTATLIAYGGIAAGVALAWSLVAGAAATLVEGVSPHGLDNLTVPLIAGLVLVSLAGT